MPNAKRTSYDSSNYNVKLPFDYYTEGNKPESDDAGRTSEAQKKFEHSPPPPAKGK